MSIARGWGRRTGTVRNRMTHTVIWTLLCAVGLVAVGGVIHALRPDRAPAVSGTPLLALRPAQWSNSVTDHPGPATTGSLPFWKDPGAMLWGGSAGPAGYVADPELIPSREESQPEEGEPEKRAEGVAQPPSAVHESRKKPDTTEGGDSTSPGLADAERTSRSFNGRPIRPVRTITMRVTAYSPGPKSCGLSADGITASGYSVWTNGMKLVAADTDLLPFGSVVTIPGYDGGQPVPVLDRGGAIKGRRLDVLYPTHQRALQWGVKEIEVTVWEYAD